MVTSFRQVIQDEVYSLASRCAAPVCLLNKYKTNHRVAKHSLTVSLLRPKRVKRHLYWVEIVCCFFYFYGKTTFRLLGITHPTLRKERMNLKMLLSLYNYKYNNYNRIKCFFVLKNHRKMDKPSI